MRHGWLRLDGRGETDFAFSIGIVFCDTQIVHSPGRRIVCQHFDEVSVNTPVCSIDFKLDLHQIWTLDIEILLTRSEERRVGKEC
ncbi:hypothetical protein, partial [Bacteroides acidifaciens]|uniref:hypothetical protein n=1 Tax=Bacteroides acidifaciens TaxID=85831 RepID=UPI0030147B26